MLLLVGIYAACVAIAAGMLQPFNGPRLLYAAAALGPLTILFLLGVALSNALIGGDDAEPTP